MIGYHFTTWKNWMRIRKEGLIPRKLENSEVYNAIFPYIEQRPKLIWLWQRKPTKEKLLGGMMRVLCSHVSTKTVLLEVEFGKQKLLTVDNKKLSVTHEGSIDNWIYHTKEPSHLVQCKIEPQYINLLYVWDFMKLNDYKEFV